MLVMRGSYKWSSSLNRFGDRNAELRQWERIGKHIFSLVQDDLDNSFSHNLYLNAFFTL